MRLVETEEDAETQKMGVRVRKCFGKTRVGSLMRFARHGSTYIPSYNA